MRVKHTEWSGLSIRLRTVAIRRGAVLIGAAGLAALSPPVEAVDWQFTPRVEAGQSYTTNVDATADGSDDWISEVAPGLAVTAGTSDFDAALDYQFQKLWYARDSDLDDHFHQFDGEGQLRLVGDALVVDLAAAYDQQNVDPERSIGVDNRVRGDNRTDVGRYQIAPSYVGTLAEGLDTRVSASYSIVDYRNTDQTGDDAEDSAQLAYRVVAGDLQDPGRRNFAILYL